MATTDVLTFKTIAKELFALALPMAFTQAVAVGSGFISMAMLGSLGPDVLAASALIFSARISIIIIGSSILFSLSFLISHAYGEREYLRIGNFVQQGWLLALLLSMPIMLIFWKMPYLLLKSGQPKELVDIVKQFFIVNVWNVLPFLLAVCNQQVCYGTRKQRIDFFANLLSVIVLLGSSYVLIYGKFGFPQLGVKGLAYALNLQGWFYFLMTAIVIYFSDFFRQFQLFKFRLRAGVSDLMRMLKMGWPISVQIGGEMLSFFVTAAMVGWLGIEPLAAYQVVTQYLFLIVVPLFAIAQASGIMIGQAYGEKNNLKIKRIGKAGTIFTIIITMIAAMVFLIFPKQLAAIYFDPSDPSNAHTLHLVLILFAIMSLQLNFDGVRNTVTGSLRGLFDTRQPMLIGLLSIWVIGIPLGYLLGFNFHWGIAGIAAGAVIGILVAMLFVLYRWQKFTERFVQEEIIKV